jgi:hypothetical protein
VVVEMLLRVPPAAVENVGVNGYVSEHGIHQPNVTNLQKGIFTVKRRFFQGGQFRFKQKKYGKNKNS